MNSSVNGYVTAQNREPRACHVPGNSGPVTKLCSAVSLGFLTSNSAHLRRANISDVNNFHFDTFRRSHS